VVSEILALVRFSGISWFNNRIQLVIHEFQSACGYTTATHHPISTALCKKINKLKLKLKLKLKN
jgi:hypothetical protein